MRTGVEGLDAVLGGGLLSGHSLLLQGTPGSGRTALGLQIVAGGARNFGEPGVILSLDPFPSQFYREALALGWNLKTLSASGQLRVIFAERDDLYSSFAERESLALSRITEAAFEIRARRLLIDPAAEFFRLPLSGEEQQRTFAEFVLKLKALDLSAVLTSNAPAASRNFGPEEAAVDAIIRLDHGPALFAGGRRQRTLEVVKARGQQVVEGRHPFRITPAGVRVTPYSPGPGPGSGSSSATELFSSELSGSAAPLLSTGVEGLDALLGGGILPASVTLLAGISGTGKTQLAARFLAAGLAGGAAVFATSDSHSLAGVAGPQDPGQALLREAAARGDLSVFAVDTADLQPIEFYHGLRELVERTGAVRVVIDGLGQILSGAGSEQERSFLLELLRGLSVRHGVTALWTCRTQEQSGLSGIAAVPGTAHADNVLYLSLTELQGRLRRLLGVLKNSGRCADPVLRELLLTPAGVSLAAFLPGEGRPLCDSASGAESHILLPLVHMRDFIHGACVDTPEQARLVLTDLRREFDVLAGQIARCLKPSAGCAGSPAGEEVK